MLHRLLVLCFLLPLTALAQSQTHGAFELGAVVGGTSGQSYGPDRASLGVRFGYSGSTSANEQHFLVTAAEAELNWISGGKVPTTTVGGQAIQAMFGFRMGLRGKKNGVTLKLRPGFLSFHDALSPTGSASRRLTLPLVETGLVYERYFNLHWAMRLDAGFPYVFYPGTDILGKSSRSSIGNSQYSAGLTYRF
ncbi:MAG TPA: hypothetical protein VF532_13310 [Candidatus Angelobacter sp.]